MQKSRGRAITALFSIGLGTTPVLPAQAQQSSAELTDPKSQPVRSPFDVGRVLSEGVMRAQERAFFGLKDDRQEAQLRALYDDLQEELTNCGLHDIRAEYQRTRHVHDSRDRGTIVLTFFDPKDAAPSPSVFVIKADDLSRPSLKEELKTFIDLSAYQTGHGLKDLDCGYDFEQTCAEDEYTQCPVADPVNKVYSFNPNP